MHLAPLIQDLAVILGVAAIMTFIFRLIKQPVVLGYIVAGIIVGPYTPALFSVVDVESVKVWAELGVILLMFSLGLEFSFRRLAKVGVSAGVTALIQIVTMIVSGYVLARLLGWSTMNAVFLGCMISISSTTIIIKALEELGLKTRRFSELVFGILIVEDLVAIVMLVGLSDVVTKASVSGVDLLQAGAKLGLVVGAWLVIGMFAVPRLVRAVGRRGNDEMLIVVSFGLCLALVALAAKFNYSVALGAFIMGSIIAETREVHRIETLVAPLKDIFGAVFFVSVGMLLDPSIVTENLGTIAAICAVIIIGKVTSVGLGALLTGQNLSTATHSGLAMAQIGEFSFIIATLGLTYKAIDERIYPIIVAASLITTFTTPYLLKAAPGTVRLIERSLPLSTMEFMERYGLWFQRRSQAGGLDRSFFERLLRWIANAIVVTTIFVLSFEKFLPWIEAQIANAGTARAVAWAATFLVSAPFIWAMLTSFKNGKDMRTSGRTQLKELPAAGPFLGRLATVIVVGALSAEFFAVWLAALITLGIAGLCFVAFRKQIGAYYRWFEDSFVAGIGGETPLHAGEAAQSHAHLVPWDAHLSEIQVRPGSHLAGKTLIELQLRERYGMNVVVIRRLGETIVAPRATERIYPTDFLLCFGTEAELDAFRRDIDQAPPPPPTDLADYGLRQLAIGNGSAFSGKTIRDSGIREGFDCMVVGLERAGKRLQSPKSDLELETGDHIWVVGQKTALRRLDARFRGVPSP